MIPEAYGGMGLGLEAASVMLQELAYFGGANGASVDPLLHLPAGLHHPPRLGGDEEALPAWHRFGQDDDVLRPDRADCGRGHLAHQDLAQRRSTAAGASTAKRSGSPMRRTRDLILLRGPHLAARPEAALGRHHAVPRRLRPQGDRRPPDPQAGAQRGRHQRAVHHQPRSPRRPRRRRSREGHVATCSMD